MFSILDDLNVTRIEVVDVVDSDRWAAVGHERLNNATPTTPFNAHVFMSWWTTNRRFTVVADKEDFVFLKWFLCRRLRLSINKWILKQ